MTDIVVITGPHGVMCLHDGCTWTHPTTNPDHQLAAWRDHNQETHQDTTDD